MQAAFTRHITHRLQRIPKAKTNTIDYKFYNRIDDFNILNHIDTFVVV